MTDKVAQINNSAELRELLRDNLTTKHLADYLTAGYGFEFAVFLSHAGVRMEILKPEDYPSMESMPIARLKCPGIAALDLNSFIYGLCEGRMSPDGLYLENGTGRVIGTIEDVVRERCLTGKMTRYHDALIRNLVCSYEYGQLTVHREHKHNSIERN